MWNTYSLIYKHVPLLDGLLAALLIQGEPPHPFGVCKQPEVAAILQAEVKLLRLWPLMWLCAPQPGMGSNMLKSRDGENPPKSSLIGMNWMEIGLLECKIPEKE